MANCLEMPVSKEFMEGGCFYDEKGGLPFCGDAYVNWIVWQCPIVTRQYKKEEGQDGQQCFPCAQNDFLGDAAGFFGCA
ncbi:hypothetical protein [Uliginosibacterium gangwonense]|uniref:hypothetical protein n=1 Tax=Uliginosibacterium gangwonense TaxID=392736 RepID=UPI0003684EA6|nr:hypothetical protein [Uliginosibacterium gangwonense]